MKISKCKKELARIISEHGGWRNGEFAAQDGDGGVGGYGEKPVWSLWGKYWRNEAFGEWFVANKIKNHHQTVLSRAEYFHLYPSPDADGWIEWKGGECPVGGDVMVCCKLRSGKVSIAAYRAGSLSWRHNGNAVDIIAYRLHKQQPKPEFCESVMRSIPEPEFDDAGSRLAKALELVKSAAPHMLRDKYKFDGNEVMGERKPTIEQLAQDYRNKLDYSNRKQDEADKANMESDAALAQLEDAIAEIGFAITPLAETEKEPELVITDWRDLQVGDEVEVFNFECPESESRRKQELMSGPCVVMQADGGNVLIELKKNLPTKGSHWNVTGIDACEFKFIRRP